MKRFFACLLIISILAVPVSAATIRWVDFGVPYESLKYALDQDIATCEQEKHLSWIDILALAACRTGGKCGLAAVKKAASELKRDLEKAEEPEIKLPASTGSSKNQKSSR